MPKSSYYPYSLIMASTGEAHMRRLRVAGFIASLPKLRIEPGSLPACEKTRSTQAATRARAPPKASQHQNVAHRCSWHARNGRAPRSRRSNHPLLHRDTKPIPDQEYLAERPRLTPPGPQTRKNWQNPPYVGCTVGRGHAVVALWPCPTGPLLGIIFIQFLSGI